MIVLLPIEAQHQIFKSKDYLTKLKSSKKKDVKFNMLKIYKLIKLKINNIFKFKT